MSEQNFTSPVGRLVQGSLHEAKTTDDSGRPLLVKSGPNAGKPTQKWFFALAIPKTDAGFNAMYQQMVTVARTGFPSLFDAAGNCVRPNFAWKLVDGDSTVLNEKGKRPCDYDGFPGHWVLKFSTNFQAPRVFDNANAPIEGSVVKLGHYVRVFGSFDANGDMNKPGLYVNPRLVQHVGYGPEIERGPSAAEAFGAPVALPPGASATPLAPAAPMPGTVATPPAAVTPPATVAPPAVVAPAHDFVAPAIPPAASAPPAYSPPPPVAAPAPVAARYILNGQAYDEAALRAAGYADTHLAGLQRV